MVDRQDIDALLISALYGELTPADEARLQTHLDSHPADRTALADLTVARNAVRESRILTVQLEPPQAVSALLLQEAARRAPKRAKAEPEREGWFQRFIRSFAAHPGVAAAAMLVLVLGVAGTLYMRGDRAVEQTADRDDVAEVTASAPAATPDTTLALESRRLEQNAGSGYQAQLDEGRLKDSEAPAGADQTGERADEQAKAEPPTKKKPVMRRGGDTYLSTERVQPQPKELDSDGDKKAAPAKRSAKQDSSDAETKGGAGFAPRPETVTATPPAVDRQPARNAPAPPPPPAAAPVVGGAASANEEQKLQVKSEDASWAREVHGRVQAAVRANDCKSATSLAMDLSNRAPGYYAQNVDNDRELKTCRTYINAEREREAERVQRARAQQRRTSDEKAAKPTAEPKATGH